MKSEEWFVLSLRVIGVVILTLGARDLLDALLFHLGYFSLLESSPRYFVVMGLAYILAGLYLMRGAPHLVRFAFPEMSKGESDDEVEDTNRQDA